MQRFEIMNAITTKIKSLKNKLSFEIFKPEIRFKYVGKDKQVRVNFLTKTHIFGYDETGNYKKIPYHVIPDKELEILYLAYKRLK